MNQKQITSLHRRATIVDGHADTFSKVLMGYDFFTGRKLPRHDVARRGGRSSDAHRGWAGAPLHIDYPRLKKSGLNLQFMAVYTPPKYQGPAATAYAINCLFEIKQAIRQSRGDIKLVLDRKDVDAINKPGHLGFLISIEGGLPLNRNLGLLAAFHQLGVRALTLTHNPRNDLGDGIGNFSHRNPHGRGIRRGLTPFGKAVVKECNRLKILLDVAHLSKPGFNDLVRLSRGPIISSHTGVRALCDIPRNLDDDQIKEIARRKGLVGIFYLPEFLVAWKKRVHIDDVVRHIQYVADKFGVDHVGLGSDFDGYEGTVVGLEDAAKLPNLTAALAKKGFNRTEIQKILGGNYIRVLKQVLG